MQVVDGFIERIATFLANKVGVQVRHEHDILLVFVSLLFVILIICLILRIL